MFSSTSFILLTKVNIDNNLNGILVEVSESLLAFWWSEVRAAMKYVADGLNIMYY